MIGPLIVPPPVVPPPPRAPAPPFAAKVVPAISPKVRAVIRLASSAAAARRLTRLSGFVAGGVSPTHLFPFQNDIDQTSGNPANWLEDPTSPVALRPRLTPSLPLSRPVRRRMASVAHRGRREVQEA